MLLKMSDNCLFNENDAEENSSWERLATFVDILLNELLLVVVVMLFFASSLVSNVSSSMNLNQTHKLVTIM